MYIPNDVLDDDIDNFDSNECLMHGDNELCDTPPVINILDVLKNKAFQEIDVELENDAWSSCLCNLLY